MSTPAITHFVFVDFENVPVIDLSAIKSQPAHVTLLIGNKQKKIDLPLVKQIKAFTAQIDLVEVGASGHNALDLTLACYLGRAIERDPKAAFAIVSRDKDFAPMIAHLRDHGVEVARHDNFHSLAFLPQPKPVPAPKNPTGAKTSPPPKKSPEDRRSKVIARLKNPLNPNRPSDETALRAHIKSALGKEASEAKVGDIVRELYEGNALTIDPAGKVSYPAAPSAGRG